MEGTLWCQRIAINSSPQITFNEARMPSCRPKTASQEKPHSTAPTILQDVQNMVQATVAQRHLQRRNERGS